MGHDGGADGAGPAAHTAQQTPAVGRHYFPDLSFLWFHFLPWTIPASLPELWDCDLRRAFHDGTLPDQFRPVRVRLAKRLFRWVDHLESFHGRLYPRQIPAFYLGLHDNPAHRFCLWLYRLAYPARPGCGLSLQYRA